MRKRASKVAFASVLMLSQAGCGDDRRETVTIDPDLKRCMVPADCGPSPTAQCSGGICEDDTWGCVGQADDRPAVTSGTATLRVKLVDTFTGEKPTALPAVRVCSHALLDPSCGGVPGASAAYDERSGTIIVSGLRQNATFRLAIDPVTPGAFMPLDFYPQRPVLGETEQEAALYTFPPELAPALGQMYAPPIPVRSDGGMIMTVYHDCANKWAQGVVQSVPAGPAFAESRTLYLAISNVPDPSLTATSPGGVALTINLPTDVAVSVMATSFNTTLTQFAMKPLPGRMTVVHAYPRKYEN